MNDVDVSSSLTREELEELVQPLLDRINVPIETALKDAGITVDELDSIEVIGGSSKSQLLKPEFPKFSVNHCLLL